MAPSRILHYEITEPLGEGGMGQVFRARDARLDRMVALKILPAGFAADSDNVARFQREARAASALHHPHIVTIHETGVADGTYFIAMELVTGVPLTAWARTSGASMARIVEVVTQVADALAVAHEAGIVHRDIKPGNILVTPQGYAKIVDFGLARVEPVAGTASDDTRTELVTRRGEILGTVAYMSPEQARGETVDNLSDIFSLGVVLYEAALGDRPFGGPTNVDTLHAILHAEPAPAATRRATATAELQWILDRALAKDRDERYQSARDMAADLRRLRRRLATSAAAAAAHPPQAAEPASRQKGRWQVAAAAIAGALGALVVAAAIWGWPAAGGPAGPSLANSVRIAPLTFDPGYEGEPSFTPDGESLVYVSNRTGNFEIFLRQVGGGPDINLTSDQADDLQPAVSPDGRYVAFVSSRSGPALHTGSPDGSPMGGDVYVMPLLGGAPRRLTSGNFPVWTPSGDEIIFVSGSWYERALYRIAVSGGEPVRIPVTYPVATDRAGSSPDINHPSLSPDGRWLAFWAAGSVHVITAAGGPAVRIASGFAPAWLGNPLAVVYTSDVAGEAGSIVRQRIDDQTGEPIAPPETLVAGIGASNEAAVSPAGRALAIASINRSANIVRQPFDFDSGRAVGQAEPVTRGNDLIYFASPNHDGTAVMYVSRRQGSTWRADQAGSLTLLSTDPTQLDVFVRWAPDGRRAVVSRQSRDDQQASNRLWIVDPDGASPRNLDRSANAGYAYWADTSVLVFQDAADQQVHALNVDTGADVRLTDEEGILPVLGGGSGWVVFQSTSSPNRNVILRAVPTTGGVPSRVVVDAGFNSYHPFLPPAGRWVYFTDHADIFRVPGPNQEWRRAPPERVTNLRAAGHFLEDPQSTPDGRYLMYSSRQVVADIYLATLDRAR